MFGCRSACDAFIGESSPEDILATRSHSAPIPSSELWSLPADMDSKPPRRDSRRTPRQDRRFPVFTCRDPDRVHIRLASPDESCGFLSWAIMGSAVTLASRLEGQCKALGVDAVFSDAVAAHVELQEVGTRELKGVQTPQKLWTLLP